MLSQGRNRRHCAHCVVLYVFTCIEYLSKAYRYKRMHGSNLLHLGTNTGDWLEYQLIQTYNTDIHCFLRALTVSFFCFFSNMYLAALSVISRFALDIFPQAHSAVCRI